MKSILFISHDATRTGAPILLLRLIEEIRRNKEINVYILLNNGGDLEKAFTELGKTWIWNFPKPTGFIEILKNKLYAKLHLDRFTKLNKYRKSILDQLKDIEVVFNNTVTNTSLLRELPLKGKRVYNYFHEMEVITERNATLADITFVNSVSKKIFCPSIAVQDFLSKNYSIPAEKLCILKYIIPIDTINVAVSECRLTFDMDDFTVGFCGTLHWRKGYEFLPLIAHYIIKVMGIMDINFMWIGCDTNLIEFIILKNDLIKLEIEDYFTFIPPVDNVFPFLSKVKVLALPSREDAFPLTVLEAAALEIPSICFNRSGGIPEFIMADAGIVVNYLDIEGMSKAIIKLKEQPHLRESLGRVARQRIHEYTNAEKIVNELLCTLSND